MEPYQKLTQLAVHYTTDSQNKSNKSQLRKTEWPYLME